MIYSLPENILEEMEGFIGGLVEGSMPLIILAIGISLAFYIIHRVIDLMPHDEVEDEIEDEIEDEVEDEIEDEKEATPREISLYLKLKQKEKEE